VKFRSVGLLLLAEVAAMSLWFVSAAVLPDMLKEVELSSFQQAALSSGVQLGFVVGALVSTIFGLADRFDPRRVFAASAIGAGLINALLLVVEPGSMLAIGLRFVTGALLAGVYPVGMKIAVGWGKDDRGFLIGALVGALTLGSASPHLIALGGGADWLVTVMIASGAAIAAGFLTLFVALGPFHAIAEKFDAKVITTAWTNKKVRLAYAGYLGHMWELYAMWAWIGVATATSYKFSLPVPEAEYLSKLTAFVAIGSGGIACAVAGVMADRIGKAEIATWAMVFSGLAAVGTALTFGGPVWITFIIVTIWGITIIPDSAQFSALVADASPPDQAGSLMTFQTALGFGLTFVTVQVVPVIAENFGWPAVILGLAAGPVFGILSMLRLRAIS